MPKEKTKIWSVQQAIVDQVNKESIKDWAKTPNLISPKVTVGKRLKNSVGWYNLVTNAVKDGACQLLP